MSARIGVFGGNFDPIHYGHINSLLSVRDKFELDRIKVVPASISPLRIQTQGSTPQQRLEMLRLGLDGHDGFFEIDTQEIDRGGVSYTIETMESYLRKDPGLEISLIIGMDQFLKFDQWKKYDQILSQADLIVTSRPGMELPYSLDEWPVAIRTLVADFDGKQAILKSGRNIHFFQLQDVEASATEIRKKVRLGQSIHSLVPPGVETYIRNNGLFKSVHHNIGDFAKFTEYCAGILNEKGGINTLSFDLRDRSAPSEFTLICSGTSTRHASALAEHLIKEVKKDYNVWPESIEGQTEGRWVVVDYGSLILHIFYDYVRQEYRLEELWNKSRK